MEIVKLDVSILQRYPYLLNTLYQSFQEEPFVMYGVMEEKILNLLCRSKNNVFYIRNGSKVEVSNIHIDGNYQITSFAEGNMQYSFVGNTCVAIRNGKIEESLVLANALDDDDPYKGSVIYTQYDSENDVECEMRFNHRSVLTTDEREHIYPFLLKDIEYVSINENARKKPFQHGLITRGHHYYAGMTVDSETYDYDLIALKEFGLLEYLHQGSRSLLENDEVTRYSRGWYLTRGEECKFLWPFGMCYKQESIKE